MIRKNTIVQVKDLREMTAQYDFRELQPYIGRVGIVHYLDEEQEEAFVSFYDYCNDEYYNAETKDWFPINQLEIAPSPGDDL